MLKTFRIGGIHAPEHKLSAGQLPETLPLPEQVVVPLSQHIGAPAKPVVAKGDEVKVGTLLAEAGGFVSAPIHSPVSGVVVKIDDVIDASGYKKPAIIIDVKDDIWEDYIYNDRTPPPPVPDLTSKEIIEKIRQAGIVGMGGAAFPTHVKLSPPPESKAEVLIINAAECEPFLTNDHALMLAHGPEILQGIHWLMQAAQVNKAFIGIESNKPDVIASFSALIAGNGAQSHTTPAQSQVTPAQSQVTPAQSQVTPVQSQVTPAQSQVTPAQSQVTPAQSQVTPAQSQVTPVQSQVTPVRSQVTPVQSHTDFHIEIVPLKPRYPQGSEKQLIDAVIGRQVASGALPVSVGAIVQNVATAFAVYEAIAKNKPLIERIVTVTGKNLARPCNLRVRIGTPIRHLIEYAGGMPEDTGKIVGGGPMMGRAWLNAEVPITKGAGGVLLVPAAEAERKEARSCVRCAKCVGVCCMGLEPYLLMTLSEFKEWGAMQQNHVMDCLECGSCSFVCPSNRPILDYVKWGKAELRAAASK
jgi:Na+-translocating ferredoxin:NAD+ oxidoreductase RnfC subunit